MKANQTIISLKEIREFFKEKCIEESMKFSEIEFDEFIMCCEKDFYQWLKDNLHYYQTEYQLTAITNMSE